MESTSSLSAESMSDTDTKPTDVSDRSKSDTNAFSMPEDPLFRRLVRKFNSNKQFKLVIGNYYDMEKKEVDCEQPFIHVSTRMVAEIN